MTHCSPFTRSIDLNTVIARFKEKNKSVPAEEPTDKEFAALCQLIAETKNEQPLVKQDYRPASSQLGCRDCFLFYQSN
jgi:hypothetical protein